MPIITLLESVPSHPWLPNVLRITMVLDKEISAPSQIDAFGSQPSALPRPKPSAMVSRIWMGVPIRAMRLTGSRSLSENSSPSAKSIKATPISESSSIS